ncbi:hypothetical protein FRC12_010546, partial [Ceratobasidium sp. 428]
ASDTAYSEDGVAVALLVYLLAAVFREQICQVGAAVNNTIIARPKKLSLALVKSTLSLLSRAPLLAPRVARPAGRLSRRQGRDMQAPPEAARAWPDLPNRECDSWVGRARLSKPTGRAEGDGGWEEKATRDVGR